ncbi:MAG: hypothetical protein A2X64_03195 [Ignavibacteria bacterium GWF2_33_9]|nr:MAG: hypothetical protein A2X64_03195 [Ignavibacteria bacterium GWF2_33_9]
MKKSTSIILWILAFLLMGSLAVYQRLTGPTYPQRGKITIGNQEIKFKLSRSTDTDGIDLIKINVPDESYTGYITLKRYKSYDEWTTKVMTYRDGALYADIPEQPAAGKVEYKIAIAGADNQAVALTDKPVVLRFKGKVPSFVLVPHIFFMFFSLVIGMRTGLEALFKGSKVYKQSFWTLIFITIGGLILGPLVQYYAFGAFWTGWPFGHDLTDNKTLAGVLGWLLAVWQIRKHPDRRWWAFIALVIMLAVYLIPHSVLGSEIDYTKLPQQ